MDLTWEFEKVGERGGAASGAWSNTLAGSDLPKEYVLPREAIQNSTDAQSERKKVYVSFQKQRLSPTRRHEIGTLLKLNDGPLAKISQISLPSENFISQFASHSQTDSEVLVIEDFGTVGLGGRLREGSDDSDRFRRLVFVLGDEGRIEEGTRGGSFGYGKTVYAQASNIRTVIYYSVFQPTEQTNNASARLFLASFFPSHTNTASYTGRAWFGTSDEYGHPWPLLDQDAHTIAEQLGFKVRSSSDTGTSLMILGSEISMDSLRDGIEKYWWPRLLDDNLDIRLFDGDEELEGPKPRLRTELRPYIRCYEMIVGRSKPTSDRERLKSLNYPKSEAPSGQWAAVEIQESDIVTDNDESDEDEDEYTEQLINKLCVMRDPRMVVDYIDSRSQNGESVAAVFVADESVEGYLRFSEPPSHDKWNSKSVRLDRESKRIVSRVLSKLKSEVREFQSSLAPATPVAAPEPLAELERMLSGLFGGTGKTKPPPPPRVTDPFRIEIRESRTETNEGSKLLGKISLGLKPGAAMAHLNANIVVRASILADDNQRVDESIDIEWLKVNGTDIKDSLEGFTVELHKDKSVAIETLFLPIDRECSAQISVQVHGADGANQSDRSNSE